MLKAYSIVFGKFDTLLFHGCVSVSLAYLLWLRVIGDDEGEVAFFSAND